MHKETECYSPPFSNVTPDLEEVKVPVGVKQGELYEYYFFKLSFCESVFFFNYYYDLASLGCGLVMIAMYTSFIIFTHIHGSGVFF